MIKVSQMKKTMYIFIVILLLGLAVVRAQTKGSHYRLANRFSVEGDGFWDLLAVDDATGRVYLSHSTMVQILDTKSGKLAGTIPDLKGVHGIAVAPDFHKGYITCGRDCTVAVFDLKTLAVSQKIKVTGVGPDAILYEPITKRIFVFNGRSSNATVIDAKSDQIAGTVVLDGKPELAASDDKGVVFVNLEDSSAVDVINPKTLMVEHKWPLAPGEEPTGMAMDQKTHRLFIGCANKMMVVMDAANGKVISTLPIGERCDGMGFDPGLKRAYSSNGEGSLTVVQELKKDKFEVLENVTTQRGARTLAVDARTHHIYLPTAEFGETPAPTIENPHPRPTLKPGSFVVLEVQEVK